MREFAFELAVAASLEAATDGLVARQLGTRDRIVDLVEIEPGPGFSERTSLTAEPIPPLAIESAVGVGTARDPVEAIDTDPDHARSVADQAIEVGFFTAERRGSRRHVRQTARYPDWFAGLHAYENKPDLDRPGDLERQLRKDVSLALFDTVTLVTDSYVTGAHRNRIPEVVGIVRFDAEHGETTVIRDAEPLSTETTGIAIGERSPARVDIEPIPSERKTALRLRLAERAYGKGWRPDGLPPCAQADARGPPFASDDALPYCQWKGRFVHPTRECGPDCGGHEAAAPPPADIDAVRAEKTPWEPDPPGAGRTQTSLDDF